MGMVVRTNMAALNANNSLQNASKAQQKGMEKLASGFKINKAADDASGLAISEKMKNQIKALDTAKDNCEDGANLIQTTEGYMSETHDMLNRMVELSEKAANGVLEDTDRKALQDEMDQLCGEIDRIATTANFNGRKLLDGSIGSNGTVQITSDTTGNHYSVSSKSPNPEGETIKADITTITGDVLTNEVSGSQSTDLTNKIAAAAEAAAKVMTERDGSAPSKVTVAYNKNGDVLVDMSDALNTDDADDAAKAGFTYLDDTKVANYDSNIMDAASNDTDKKAAITKYNKDQGNAAVISYNNANCAATATQTSNKYAAGENVNGYETIDVDITSTTGDVDGAIVKEGIKLQIGESSTAADKLEVSVGSFHTDTLLGGINGFKNFSAAATGETDSSAIASTKANSTSTYNNGITIDIGDQNKASAAADALRQVSNYVSDQRGKLGAQQNRLDHTVNNLTTASENTTAANSRIRDTDMAKEMMAYTSKNVIAQAAQSMLAQANSQPQNVLSLLQ